MRERSKETLYFYLPQEIGTGAITMRGNLDGSSTFRRFIRQPAWVEVSRLTNFPSPLQLTRPPATFFFFLFFIPPITTCSIFFSISFHFFFFLCEPIPLFHILKISTIEPKKRKQKPKRFFNCCIFLSSLNLKKKRLKGITRITSRHINSNLFPA